MSIGHVKRVTFLCPNMVTGGPEAIHQAAQLLNEQGLHADIAYYGGDSNHHFEDGAVICTPPTENPCLAAYARYEPVVCRRFLLRRHHLVVLPEPLAVQAPLFRRATVAVWWLSVDNGLLGVEEAVRRAFFADREVRHLTQSAYAADFLRRNGVPGSHPLSDYTDPVFTSFLPDGPNPELVVAFNPAKGGDLAEAFFTAHPGVRSLPLQGMSKQEMLTVLRRTSVYADFGNLPGKDRMPREAAASGAVVFLRNLGAGRYHEDFPVPDFFRFDDDDVRSGELRRRIAAVHAQPEPYWEQQAPFREVIRGERAGLSGQLLALRGRRTAA